jgi:hypothetical protein
MAVTNGPGTVTDYYSVQVKSNTDPWVFKSPERVSWLLEHPTPLFLACVDKAEGILSVYQTIPRFFAAFWEARALKLIPEMHEAGEAFTWKDYKRISLSAPILRVSLGDFSDEARLAAMRAVFEYWVKIDSHNCALRRVGLLRFRMPPKYETNQVPEKHGTVEYGSLMLTEKQMSRAVQMLFESASCVGHQLFFYDQVSALLSALTLRQLRRVRGNDLTGVGDITGVEVEVCRALDRAMDRPNSCDGPPLARRLVYRRSRHPRFQPMPELEPT